MLNMFLEELNPRQKSSFLALATRVILADGDVAPEEDVILNRLKKSLGSGIVAPPEEVFGVTNTAVFPSRRSRRITFLELLVLAYADEKVHPDESTVLTEISGALEIEEKAIDNLSGWAHRYVSSAADEHDTLKAEAESLIDG